MSASKAGSSRESILPELARILRGGRFGPRAFVAFFRLAIGHGSALSRQLPHLRRSYLRSLWAVAAPIAAALVALGFVVETPVLLAVTGLQVFAFAAWAGIGYLQLSAVRAPGGAHYPRFGVANTLTMYRLVAMPLAVVLVLLQPQYPDVGWLLCSVYGSAAFSDLLDGIASRAFGQISDFGRIWDPIGDILFNPSVALALAAIGEAPWWLAGLAAYRYWGALLAGTILYVVRGPFVIMPTLPGKLAGFALGWVMGFGVLRTALGGSWPAAEAMTWAYRGAGAILGVCTLYLTVRGILMLRHPGGVPGKI